MNVLDTVGVTYVQNYTVIVNPAYCHHVVSGDRHRGNGLQQHRHRHQRHRALFNQRHWLQRRIERILASIEHLDRPGAGTVTLSGTATNSGTTAVSFTVNVTDAAGATLSKTYSVTFNGPLGLAPAVLPSATAGYLYNQVATVSSGTTPYSLTVTNFNAGGTGLTVSQIVTNSVAGTFTINGTPSGAGTATFTLKATDTAGATVTQGYSLLVNPA